MRWPTAASVISDAAIRLGLVPSAIADPYASTDENIVRLRTALATLGVSLLRGHNWSHLTEEWPVSTFDGVPFYELPPDFVRVVNGTTWNRTLQQPVLGPLSGKEWQKLKATTSTSTFQAFRIWQNRIYIWPEPTASETIYYEYVTDQWVAPNSDDPPDSAEPTTADQVLWFPRDLLHWGLRLQFKQDTGQDASLELREFQDAWAATTGGDAGAPVLNVSPNIHEPRMLDGSNLPDTGYGE
jgi:hypothetical protein